jgi:hypothetical protein
MLVKHFQAEDYHEKRRASGFLVRYLRDAKKEAESTAS